MKKRKKKKKKKASKPTSPCPSVRFNLSNQSPTPGSSPGARLFLLLLPPPPPSLAGRIQPTRVRRKRSHAAISLFPHVASKQACLDVRARSLTHPSQLPILFSTQGWCLSTTQRRVGGEGGLGSTSVSTTSGKDHEPSRQ
ncbi:hypothetical protein LX32DRAFT_35140 [Colletotrichum zoysiae]|uniref:Uncharacterized protein n=1 Tax=Colletotrichum zoysiae TaxID=1216348 RepID=A0AAD9HC67_9PEZI|nr:hypothetical protein LX32DRAFT_35140 [Colletotrichum zoysiae]